MAKETYRMPFSPSEFYEFQRNAMSLCKINKEVWKLPQERLDKTLIAQSDYEEKYAVTVNRSTQSPAATVARDASLAIYKPLLEEIYNKDLLNNDAITAELKESLHIHTMGGGGSKSLFAPSTTPLITLTIEEISVLHVVFSDSATPGSHAKPEGVVFCELWYNIGTEAPASPDDCKESCNIARSNEKIIFASEQRGKNVYAYGRWVSRTGKTGPWSGMIHAIIP